MLDQGLEVTLSCGRKVGTGDDTADLDVAPLGGFGEIRPAGRASTRSGSLEHADFDNASARSGRSPRAPENLSSKKPGVRGYPSPAFVVNQIPLAIEANPEQNGLRAAESGECPINAQSLADVRPENRAWTATEDNMAAALNHTIIWAKDKWASARFLADILGVEAWAKLRRLSRYVSPKGVRL